MIMKERIMSLDEIFNLIRMGERKEGVELLYSFHYNKLYGVAFLFVKNEMIAEDIVNNAIYKLLNLKLELFPTSHVSTWLYSFMKNEALMFLRREKPTISIDNILNVAKEDHKIEDYVNMNAYYSMIKNLTKDQKQIVTLKVIGGYTHKEIAEMLERPIGTIQWIYNTSIKKLKYIFTSLFMIAILTGGTFIFRFISYIQAIMAGGANSTLPSEKNTSLQLGIVILLGVCFLAELIIFIVLYKKTDKIPTKVDKKII